MVTLQYLWQPGWRVIRYQLGILVAVALMILLHQVLLPRAFDEPDYALLSSPQPHTYRCSREPTAPLLYVGIFSTPSASSGRRRDILRELVVPHFPSSVIVRFILAQPSVGCLAPALRGYWRDKLLQRLGLEQETHGDLVILDTEDNMDDGKTHAFFKYLVTAYPLVHPEPALRDPPQASNPPPQFVMKCDEDTLIVPPNVIASFAGLDCTKNVYWGTSSGCKRLGVYPEYLRGLAYALSWPLVAWIGNANVSTPHVVGTEDARTGQWLKNLDDASDPVVWADLHWAMGDWDQVRVTNWLKRDEWVYQQHARIQAAWDGEGRNFTIENGRSFQKSAEAGKRLQARQRKAQRVCSKWNIVPVCRWLGYEM